LLYAQRLPGWNSSATPLAVPGRVVCERAQLVAMGLEIGRRERRELPEAAGVRQQLMDGDLGGDLAVGVVGQIGSQRSGELDLAGLDQLEDRHRGEHLRHRPDPKPRPDGVRSSALAIGQPVGAAEEHPAVLRDQHRAGELILARERRSPDRKGIQGVRLGRPPRTLRLLSARAQQHARGGQHGQRFGNERAPAVRDRPYQPACARPGCALRSRPPAARPRRGAGSACGHLRSSPLSTVWASVAPPDDIGIRCKSGPPSAIPSKDASLQRFCASEQPHNSHAL
jgi:hypothetical protein